MPGWAYVPNCVPVVDFGLLLSGACLAWDSFQPLSGVGFVLVDTKPCADDRGCVRCCAGGYKTVRKRLRLRPLLCRRIQNRAQTALVPWNLATRRLAADAGIPYPKPQPVVVGLAAGVIEAVGSAVFHLSDCRMPDVAAQNSRLTGPEMAEAMVIAARCATKQKATRLHSAIASHKIALLTPQP